MTLTLLGWVISGGCLLVTHELLGMTSVVTDDVWADLIGVGLGAVLHFVTCQKVIVAPVPRVEVTTAPRVLIVSAGVGAGHDGAARELARQATQAGYAVDRVDFLDLLPLGLGRMLRAAYHLQLRLAPVTWGWSALLLGSSTGGRAARLTSWLAARRLLASCHPEPCAAISTYPLASHALSRLRLRGEFWSPVITFLTDMSVHPLWVAPGVDHHLALHTVPAAEAVALGARAVEVVGPAVDPSFVVADPQDRVAARVRWGLNDDLPLALVVAGSWGVGEVGRTAADLLATGLVRPVVVCGTNIALVKSVAAVEGLIALGWVEDMAGLMLACDLVVQNAGGLTSLEARQCGLPVLTYRSLPGHGLSNAAALEEAGWAAWARDPDTLREHLRDALLATRIPTPSGSVDWHRLALTPAPVRA